MGQKDLWSKARSDNKFSRLIHLSASKRESLTWCVCFTVLDGNCGSVLRKDVQR